jgi:hypothetical protein
MSTIMSEKNMASTRQNLSRFIEDNSITVDSLDLDFLNYEQEFITANYNLVTDGGT